VATALGVDPVTAIFEFVAFVNQERGVAAVVNDEFRAFVAGKRERVECAIPIFFQRLTLPSEHRSTGLGNRGGRVVLRRENVAARPAHRCAEFHERLNQDGRLNGHV